jgi:hypothetical protein
MTNSDTEPEVLFLDYVKDGQCRLLVRWSITKAEREDPMTGKAHISWNYSERVIWWILPQKYDTLEEILAYLDTTEKEILNWAEATDTAFEGTATKVAAKAYAVTKSEEALKGVIL